MLNELKFYFKDRCFRTIVLSSLVRTILSAIPLFVLPFLFPMWLWFFNRDLKKTSEKLEKVDCLSCPYWKEFKTLQNS